MFYRKKTYQVQPDFVPIFNKHFNKNLLPTQLKYGARLIGRWMTDESEDLVEIFAIWEYDSYEDYVEIERQVRSDEVHVRRVKEWYELHGGRDYVLSQNICNVKNEHLYSTVGGQF
ncbi:NIPSNAP family protein [Bacillaceae bacterium W0354]